MGRNLPLKTRRRNAFGLNARTQRAWGGRRFVGVAPGNRASKVFGTGNSSVVVYYREPGTAGNSITVAFVAAGASTALSVAVAGNAITVNLATNSSSVAISTASEVARAIDFANTPALLSKLHAQRAPGSDGSGVVAAVAATALAGGTAAG